MASYASTVVGSVFEELPTLSSASEDVCSCLLNNRLHIVQPHMGMDLEVIKAAMGWYYRLVRAVFIQSPQVAYVDVSLGDAVTSPDFCNYFL